MLLVDLVLGGNIAAVTDEDGSSELLVEHTAHLALHPGDDIEVGNIDDVVAVELLLLVDGGRGGDALEELEDLLLLQVALDVTTGTSLVSRNIGSQGLDAGEG